MTQTLSRASTTSTSRGPRPMTVVPRSPKGARAEQGLVGVFVVVPFLAVLAAVPVAWGWGLGWHDIVIAAVFYAVSGHGITVGFHRYFTHGSFKAPKFIRVALAVAGSMAVEGPVNRWVADHRRHHAFSDKEGDPHSPWRYGEDIKALTKGFFHAHVGWLFDLEQTNQERFIPDLLADRAIVRVSKSFSLIAFFSFALPAAGRLRLVRHLGRRRHRVLLGQPGPGRRCCTTSRGRSTRSATPSVRSPSSAATRRATCGGSRSRRWVSRGTTCTTPTRPPPVTVFSGASSTPRPG